MARKKKAEEHVNLERWLVSYADFITLLFATFVVLYALSQVDINEFSKLEDALKKAFSAPTVMDGQMSVFDSSSNSILDGTDGSMNPIMLEYLSPKYEETSFQEIKDNIDKMDVEGLNATIDDRGLVIKLNDKLLNFESGSAEISPNSYHILNKIGNMIKEKFAIHLIRVEGHTDSKPITNHIYPTNWELSSARASSVIRYLINKFGFSPKLFIAAGYADTKPVSDNKTASHRAQNRRVEIVVIKNKYKRLEGKDLQELMVKKTKKNKPENEPPKDKSDVSQAVKNLAGENKELLENVIDLKSTYNKENNRMKNLETERKTGTHTHQRPDFME